MPKKKEVIEIAEAPALVMVEEQHALLLVAEKLSRFVPELSAKAQTVLAETATVEANAFRLAETSKTAEIAQNYKFGVSGVLLALDEVGQALDKVEIAIAKLS